MSPNSVLYFDNAATSFPKPESVYVAMDQFMREQAANPGRAGHRMAVETESSIEQSRVAINKLFNVGDPKRCVFTLNGTDALNIAMKGLLKSGDHVITTHMEHNSVIRPLNAMERAGKIELDWCLHESDGYLLVETIEQAIRPHTKLIVINHASNVTGAIQPIRAIGALARAKGILLLVDASQTAGAVPIDMQADNIDLLAMAGHKALLGPPGTGVLLVGTRVEIEPFREGGTGTDSETPVQPSVMPQALEAGTPNSQGIVGLGEGARYVLAKGVEVIRAHELSLIKHLRDGLERTPNILFYTPQGENITATLSFNLDGLDPQEVGAILDEHYGIACRPGLHCAPMIHTALGTAPSGCVRLSPGVFNTLEQIDQVVEAIATIQKEMAL